ncbi:MAG: AsnC family transcriptional regulator, partial [Sphingomonadaceae bacterium]
MQADLDEIDHELLRLLTQNSRMTNADLAAAVGIAQS